VRALAVLAVLVGHFLDDGRGDPHMGPELAQAGVIVFFVLSGYLITGLLLAEYGRSQDISLRRFYFRRACRIFPAYYVFLAVSWALLSNTDSPMSRGGILATTTYTSNYYIMANLHTRELEGLIHTWSLAVEEQFYLLWPAAFLLLLRRGGMNWVRCALALAIAGRLVVFGPWYLSYHFQFEAHAHWLAIGCLLATVPSTLLVRWTWAPQWMRHPVLVWIGTISYPLYLWHMWGGGLGRMLGEGVMAQFGLGVILSIALASASYYAVERPVLRWRDLRSSPSPTRLSKERDQ
jgi:peptidoglycan/LPS O-acetylase OafA/YrhL